MINLLFGQIPSWSRPWLSYPTNSLVGGITPYAPQPSYDGDGYKIFSSFKEWFENTLLSEGRAFKNYTSELYPMIDNRLNAPTYSSPFYQWVYDHSISGADIPTASGLNVPYIDYINGRTISGSPTGQVSYAVKDFNIYNTTKSDAKLLFESKYNVKPKPRNIPPSSGMAPYQVLAPCIFLKLKGLDTALFDFGAGISQKLRFSAIVVSDDEFKSYGVGSIFSKKKNCVFPYFDETPLNYLGDYKSGNYNYKDKVTNNKTPQRYVRVNSVKFTTVEADRLTKNNPNLFFSKVDFECNFH